MAENSAISWCHHTFNLGWGCYKKSEGCKNCYAERDSKRYGFDIWGEKKIRRLLSRDYYDKPIKWNKKAEELGERHRVFCGSMMDWTDECWYPMLPFLWQMWRDTPSLDWLMLTKNAENIKDCLPPDWSNGYNNVWMGVTAENQKQANIRLPRLIAVPAAIRFISIEPMLEGMNISEIPLDKPDSTPLEHGIDWVIVGGESGPNARPMKTLWARSVRNDCKLAEVPFFMKQMPGNTKASREAIPKDLQIREFPE